ncbi:hypothetical protein Btru_004061 [Bulinus truncatus]|nr:hypothetical protein Btru_004061 [Bulinus truncatus]
MCQQAQVALLSEGVAGCARMKISGVEWGQGSGARGTGPEGCLKKQVMSGSFLVDLGHTELYLLHRVIPSRPRPYRVIPSRPRSYIVLPSMPRTYRVVPSRPRTYRVIPSRPLTYIVITSRPWTYRVIPSRPRTYSYTF